MSEIAREIELDTDGWWTVWEDGDYIGLFESEVEASKYVADLEALEAIDRFLLGETG